MESPRVGIFGGSFDPVHLGHLILAEQCREQARLDQVWFVPAARQPLKQGQAVTPFRHRLEMLSLAVAGHPAFRVDNLEEDRPGPSFTVDTLEELSRRHSRHQWFLILGADSLGDLTRWYEPVRILQRATLLAVARPGWEMETEGSLRSALHLPPEVPLRLEVVRSPLVEIASRDLRRRVAEGHSIRYLVPRAVECYLETHRLYQEKGP